MKSESLEDIKRLIEGKPSLEIGFDLVMSGSYETWVHNVQRAIDHALRRMAQNPELREHKSEDELTIELVSLLNMMEVEADHETKVGGHVDIKIKWKNDCHWLGEAKKHKQDYSWIYQGFEQLNSRYTTGLPGQDQGGLLIYSPFARVDRTMSAWKAHLGDKKIDGMSFEDCSLNDLSFYSSHPHERTGRPLKVRHIPLSIYFDPKDRK